MLDSLTGALEAIRSGDADALAQLLDANPELVRVELVEILVAAGGRVDARRAYGITPLESAIYHGSRAAADVLAAIALIPDAPWIAAGVGRVDRLEQFLDGEGGLVAEGLPAPARPHRPGLAAPPARARRP